jgi:hypothetical protein
MKQRGAKAAPGDRYKCYIYCANKDAGRRLHTIITIYSNNMGKVGKATLAEKEVYN